MRFERLGHTPVLVRELEVDGAHITTRDGGAVATRAFATAEAAREHADALTKAWRGEGYIPIQRLAPAAPEEPIKRDQRFEWRDRKERRFREIFQKNDAVRIIDGRIEAGDDVRERPETIAGDNQKVASAIYESWVARTEREIEEANERTRAFEAEQALRAEKAALRKKQKQRERFGKNVHAELERECRASPHASGPWQVYADWLMERDDDVGEIAALALGGDTRGAVFKALAFLDAPDEATVEVALRHGFIHHLTLKGAEQVDLAELVRRVLVSPACRFVESLALGLASHVGYENDWAPALSAITDSFQAPLLRELRLNAYDANDCELSWVPHGDLAFAWAKLPALELLHIRAGGSGNLGTLDLPRLRTFIRETGGMVREDIRTICRVPRPTLEHLELWTGTTAYEGEITLDDLAPVLAGDHFPALRHLGIVNSELSDVIIPALVASRILPQLHSLDLSMGIFARAATTQLVEHAPHFRHLAALDLSENVLLDDEIGELRAVLDNVITNGQRERDEDFPDDPGERYVAVGE